MIFLQKQSESWLKMQNIDFKSICNISNIPRMWQENDYISNNLMPVNNYVKIFGNPPKVKDIQSDKITIVQKTYSDIYIQKNEIETYAIERSWQRQFYPSSNKYPLDNINFFTDKTYKFYMPWIINNNINYKISLNNKNDFFYVPEQIGCFNYTDNNINVPFIDFYFTKNKNYVEKDNYIIIPSESNMYNLEIYMNNNLIKDLLKFYEKK